jgi:large subunit ribosomal protein L31
MKEGIHPTYRLVIFNDVSSGFRLLTRSTIQTKDTAKWDDGKEYPSYNVEISSASHPFFTGKQVVVDTAGRIEKFRRRYGIQEKTEE